MNNTFRSVLLAVLCCTAVGHANAGTSDASASLKGDHKQSYTSLRASLKASMSAAEWAKLKTKPLSTVSMRDRWIGEDRPGFEKDGTRRRTVDYLHDPSARSRFVLEIGKDGRLYSNGKPFDTHGELVNAVMDTDGNLYADGPQHGDHGLHLKHSSFLAGAPADIAFEIEGRQGKPKRLTNRSGHYRMKRLAFMAGLLKVEKRLDLSEAEVNFDPKSE